MPDILNKYHTGEYFRGAGYPIGRSSPSPVVIQDDLDEIFSSIVQILNTDLRERPMYPEFGCNLKRLLWDPLDSFIQQDIDYEIRKALYTWEPRVDIVSIKFDMDDYFKNRGILPVSIELRVISNPGLTRTVEVPIFPPV